MNQTASEIANKFDDELAKIYVATTVEVFVCAAALIVLLFVKLGVSSFIILQACGISLFAFLIGSVCLQVRKKNIRKMADALLRENAIDESEFINTLNANPASFEFIRALYLTPKKLKENGGKSNLKKESEKTEVPKTSDDVNSIQSIQSKP